MRSIASRASRQRYSFLLVTLLLVVSSTTNKAQAQPRPANAKVHVVNIMSEQVGDSTICVTDPQVLQTAPGDSVKAGDFLVFYARGVTATVDNLNRKACQSPRPATLGPKDFCTETTAPGAQGLNGGPESGLPSFADRRARIIKIHPRASGRYEYKVTCDGHPDDPPSVIVDP